MHSILPADIYAKTKASTNTKGVVNGQIAVKSYDQAAAECKHAVEKIAKECRRVNHKYRDPHFDIEFDLKRNQRDCLDALGEVEDLAYPKSVKRIPVSVLHFCFIPIEAQSLTCFRISSKTPCSLKRALPLAMCVRDSPATAGFYLHCVLFATRKIWSTRYALLETKRWAYTALCFIEVGSNRSSRGEEAELY